MRLPFHCSLNPISDNFDADGIEPFDEGLDRHIWSLSDQRLQWDGEIARKRREKPDEVQRLMQELLETQRAVDEMEAEEYATVVDDDRPEEPDCELCSLFVEDDTDKETVPEQTYAAAEDTARKTFAIVEIGRAHV